MAIPRRSFLVAVSGLLSIPFQSVSLAFDPMESRPVSFNGQLKSICDEIRTLMAKDPILAELKTLKIGRVVSLFSPDVNFEPAILRELRLQLSSIVNDQSNLVLFGEYQIVESETADNKGLQVVVLKLTLRNRKGSEIAQVVGDVKVTTAPSDAPKDFHFEREISNNSDIAQIMGATVKLDSKSSFAANNKLVSEAIPNPSLNPSSRPYFGLIKDTRVTTVDGTRYGVEIIKREKTPQEKSGKKSDGSTKLPMSPIRPIAVRGLAYVPILIDEVFAIRIFNYDKTKGVLARIKIDGLDVLNTYNDDGVEYPGYVLNAAKEDGSPSSSTIQGWLRTLNSKGESKVGSDDKPNSYQFVINELGKGSATEKGVASGVGVISVSFFEELVLGKSRSASGQGEAARGQEIDVIYKTASLNAVKEPTEVISVRYNEPTGVQ